MTEFDSATAEFRTALGELINQHWDAIRPKPDDDDIDPIHVAEMGMTYPSAWVLVVTAGSIENASAPAAAMRLTPDGQLVHTTIGLLYDTLQMLSG